MRRLLPLLMCLVSACFIGAGWVLVVVLVFITRLMTVARFLLGLTLAAFLVGCGSGMNPQFAKPIKQHNPFVLIIGDSLVTAWDTPEVAAANPQWIFAGSPQGITAETSAQVLARTPAAIAQGNPINPGHPDVTVILIGTFDIAQPTWEEPCGDHDASAPDNTCSNLAAMIALAQQAGSKVLVCNLPITGEGTTPNSAGSVLLEANPLIGANESFFNQSLALTGGLGGFTENGSVDLAAATEGIAWTTDGVTPNSSGAELFTSVLQASVASLKVGGTL